MGQASVRNVRFKLLNVAHMQIYKFSSFLYLLHAKFKFFLKKSQSVIQSFH